MEALGCDKEHIRLFYGAHAKVAPGKGSTDIQDYCSRELFGHKPSVKKELWGGEFCKDGYYVAKVGERANWHTVEKYIQKQGKPKTEIIQLRLFNCVLKSCSKLQDCLLNYM